MGYKVVETEQAVQDLDGILGYIANSLANPSAAAAFADEVEKCYTNLEGMPLMYEQCRDSRLRVLGYRKAVIKNYILIYRVGEKFSQGINPGSFHFLQFADIHG